MLLHSKICDLSYPLYSLLALASYFMLLEHYFWPAEQLCVSGLSQSLRAVWAESAASWAVTGTGHPSAPGFLVHVSALSIFAQIVPDYTKLPRNASQQLHRLPCLLWSRLAVHGCG